jgi:hypothetical protein
MWYRTCTSELHWQLSSVDLKGLIWYPSRCIFLLYNLGSDLMENMPIVQQWMRTVIMYCRLPSNGLFIQELYLHGNVFTEPLLSSWRLLLWD